MIERLGGSKPIPLGPNDNAWVAMAFALAAIVMIAIAWWLATASADADTQRAILPLRGGSTGIYWPAALGLAMAGVYYAITGHSLAVRGFATNGRMARLWGLIALIAAVAIIVNGIAVFVILM